MFKQPNKPDILQAEDGARNDGVPPDALQIRSTEEILNELQELRFEFEMQRKELHQALKVIKDYHDSYTDLFNFAPACFINLTKTGRISAINQAGIALLGDEHDGILNRRFSSYVVQEEQDQWKKFFTQVVKHGGNNSCELSFQRRDNTIFNGLLTCKQFKNGKFASALLIKLIDITEIKQTEAARNQFEKLILKLTRREREVLVLALSGITNKDISIRLQVTQRTVENHRSRIHRKTGIISLLDLAQQAANAGVTLSEIALSFNSITI